jgi:hypothetical protein
MCIREIWSLTGRSFALGAIIFCLSLTSCAQQSQSIWLKPGAQPDEFSQERYACLQQSQQPNSSAYINRYGGAANSNMITNGGLFDACMNSRGWILTPVTDVKGFNDATKVVGLEMRDICSREDLQPLFRKKMACKARDATPEQLSDRSKITNEERAALTKWQGALLEGSDKFAAIYRQYDAKNGDSFATTLETGVADSKKLASEFAQGAFAWGEYNKRRIDLNKRLEENQKIALTY